MVKQGAQNKEGFIWVVFKIHLITCMTKIQWGKGRKLLWHLSYKLKCNFLHVEIKPHQEGDKPKDQSHTYTKE